MSRLHIAVDAGRHEVKTIGPDGYVDRFPSWIGSERILKLTNEMRPTDNVLRIPGGAFFVGDIAREESHDGRRLMIASKVHDDTKILVTTAISRAVRNGTNVILTTGVPVDQSNESTKKRLSQLLTGHYSVEINGMQRQFTIEKVNVAVEGPSAYAILCGASRGIRRIIDVGSRTINYGTIINGRYLDIESGTMDYGFDTAGGNASALATKFIGDLSRIWRDFSASTHLIGGGATQCANALAKFIPNLHLSSEPEFVNARAFWEIGERVTKGRD